MSSTKLFTKFLSATVAVSALLGTACWAFAQAPAIVAPTPLKIENAETQGFGREGLHRIRFTVKADGTIADTEVTGGFTNPMAAQFLTQSVQGWTFNPGTVNGQASDFFNQEFIIAARMGQDLTISPSAQEAFDEVGVLTSEENYKKALRELGRAIDSKLVTVLDYTIAHILKSDILMETEDYFGALEASKIATMSRIDSTGTTRYFLPANMLEATLRKRFLLAASVGQNVEAYRTWQILQSVATIPAGDSIRQQADAIRAVAEAPEIISRASILDKTWSYEPQYRIFAVSGVEGRISKINVRCERRQELELDFEENVDWALPDSYGKCVLDFIGKNNTVFNVHEFAE